MPNSDPRYRVVYQYLTLMYDSYKVVIVQNFMLYIQIFTEPFNTYPVYPVFDDLPVFVDIKC